MAKDPCDDLVMHIAEAIYEHAVMNTERGDFHEGGWAGFDGALKSVNEGLKAKGSIELDRAQAVDAVTAYNKWKHAVDIQRLKSLVSTNKSQTTVEAGMEKRLRDLIDVAEGRKDALPLKARKKIVNETIIALRERLAAAKSTPEAQARAISKLNADLQKLIDANDFRAAEKGKPKPVDPIVQAEKDKLAATREVLNKGRELTAQLAELEAELAGKKGKPGFLPRAVPPELADLQKRVDAKRAEVKANRKAEEDAVRATANEAKTARAEEDRTMKAAAKAAADQEAHAQKMDAVQREIDAATDRIAKNEPMAKTPPEKAAVAKDRTELQKKNDELAALRKQEAGMIADTANAEKNAAKAKARAERAMAHAEAAAGREVGGIVNREARADAKAAAKEQRAETAEEKKAQREADSAERAHKAEVEKRKALEAKLAESERRLKEGAPLGRPLPGTKPKAEPTGIQSLRKELADSLKEEHRLRADADKALAALDTARDTAAEREAASEDAKGKAYLDAEAKREAKEARESAAAVERLTKAAERAAGEGQRREEAQLRQLLKLRKENAARKWDSPKAKADADAVLTKLETAILAERQIKTALKSAETFQKKLAAVKERGLAGLAPWAKKTKAEAASDAAKRAQAEQAKARADFYTYMEDLKPRNMLQRLGAAQNIGRAFQVSGEVSPMFRQFNPAFWTDTGKWLEGSQRGFRALSAAESHKMMTDLESLPGHDIYVKAGLGVSGHEDVYQQGSALKNVPVVREVVGKSEDFTNAMGHYLRRTIADALLEPFGGVTAASRGQIDMAVNAANTLTGKGATSKFGNDMAKAAQFFMFSAQQQAAIIKNMTGEMAWRGLPERAARGLGIPLKGQPSAAAEVALTDPIRRKLAAKWFRLMATRQAALMVASYASRAMRKDEKGNPAQEPYKIPFLQDGAFDQPENNRTSSMTGRIRVGNRLIDITGGQGRIVSILSKSLMSEKMNAEGKRTPLDSGLYGKPTVKDEVLRFLQSKANPAWGRALAVGTHEDFAGNPVKVLGEATPAERTSAVARLVVQSIPPMILGDVIDNFPKSMSAGEILDSLSSFAMSGVGLSNYSEDGSDWVPPNKRDQLPWWKPGSQPTKKPSSSGSEWLLPPS